MHTHRGVVDERLINHFEVVGASRLRVHDGSLLEATDEDWDRSFAINVRAMARMSEAFLPGMIAAGGGSIINMSSLNDSRWENPHLRREKFKIYEWSIQIARALFSGYFTQQ